MVNKVILVGRAGCDGNERVKELKKSGSILASFGLATSERRKDRDGEWTEHTIWHNVSSFGKQAEYVEKYLKKGDLVYVEGSIDQWKDDKGAYHTQIKAHIIRGIPTGNREGSERSSGAGRDRGDSRRDNDSPRGRDSERRDPPRRDDDRGRGGRESGRGRADGYQDGPPESDIPF